MDKRKPRTCKEYTRLGVGFTGSLIVLGGVAMGGDALAKHDRAEAMSVDRHAHRAVTTSASGATLVFTTRVAAGKVQMIHAEQRAFEEELGLSLGLLVVGTALMYGSSIRQTNDQRS